jgi:hypothetical protein
MAIVWCDKNEAMEEFHKQLLPWVQTSMLRDLYSAAETKEYVTDAVKWAFMGGSQTALDLFYFIQKATEPIHIIGMKGGFQCFGSEEGLRGNKRAVFIDIDGILSINQRASKDEHNLVMTPGTSGKPGFKLVRVRAQPGADDDHVSPREFKGTVIELSNKIAALHELGHAKQCIERPSLFAGKIGSKPNPRMKPEKGGPTPFAAEIQAAALARAQRAGGSRAPRLQPLQGPTDHIGSKAELETFASAPPAWDPVIEMDNMARHEWPICREMKIGFRTNYCDLSGTTGAKTAQLSTLISRKVKEVEDKARQEKEHGDPALRAAAQTAGVKHRCPVTHAEFVGKQKIMMHKLGCATCKAMD